MSAPDRLFAFSDRPSPVMHLGRQFDRLLGIGLLQGQPAIGLRPQPTFVQDLLDGDRGDPDALQRQHRFEPVAAIGRMRQCQRPDALHRLRRGGLRMALVDRRQVLQPLEALRLEPPLPFVEAGAIQAALPTGLGNVPQFFASSSTFRRCCASFVSASRFCGDRAFVD